MMDDDTLVAFSARALAAAQAAAPGCTVIVVLRTERGRVSATGTLPKLQRARLLNLAAQVCLDLEPEPEE